MPAVWHKRGTKRTATLRSIGRPRPAVQAPQSEAEGRLLGAQWRELTSSRALPQQWLLDLSRRARRRRLPGARSSKVGTGIRTQTAAARPSRSPGAVAESAPPARPHGARPPAGSLCARRRRPVPARAERRRVATTGRRARRCPASWMRPDTRSRDSRSSRGLGAHNFAGLVGVGSRDHRSTDCSMSTAAMRASASICRSRAKACRSRSSFGRAGCSVIFGPTRPDVGLT